MSYRIIDMGDCDIYTLHAVEEYILGLVTSKSGGPTLIFSRPSEPSISLGTGQNFSLDVNAPEVTARNIPVTRRKTGGRSAYLDQYHYVVSVIEPHEESDKDVMGNYERVCGSVLSALQRATGIEACVENKNDLVVAGRKIGGAAQHATSGAHLVHCYIRHTTNLDDMLGVITVAGIGLQPYRADFERFTSSVVNEGGANWEVFRDDFREAAIAAFTGEPKDLPLTSEENEGVTTLRRDYMNDRFVRGTGKEPTRGNCDLVAGNDIKILTLADRVAAECTENGYTFK